MYKSKVIEDPSTGKTEQNPADFELEKKRVGKLLLIILIISVPTMIYLLFQHLNK
jgi:hypothetical protein